MIWLAALTVDLLLCVASYIYLPLPIAILVIGSRQHALGLLGHDGAHGLAFADRTVNDRFTRICFGLLGMRLIPYRLFHMPHHANLGHSGDPELPLKQHKSWWVFSWKYVARDLAGLTSKEALNMWRHAGGDYRLIGLVITVMALVSPMFAVAWVIALSTVFVACNRQRMIIEHGTPYKYNILHKLILFPHNGWKHAEHHADASIPYYKL